MVIHSYKDLIVWQKGMDVAVSVYELTENYPKEEIYGLISQMRRAATSIPANIAEGRHRGTRKDFTQFLRIAHSSAAELETFIILSKRLQKTKNLEYSKVDQLLLEVIKMLNSMIRKMNPRTPSRS